jgi:anti-sigma factor RsiW
MTTDDDAYEIRCQELVELVTDYLEGALSAAARQSFESHLAGCPACQAYLTQMRSTIDLLGRPSPAQLAEAERVELLRLFRGWKAV